MLDMTNPADEKGRNFSPEDVDRILGLADQFLEDWEQHEGKKDPKCAEGRKEWDALRPLLIAGTNALDFADRFAQFEPYKWIESEGSTDEQGCDAIACMNDMIVAARVVMECTALPADEIGEQPDPEAECQNCEWKGPESALKEIEHLSMRVGAGETMPAGECPKCGALAHLIKEG